MTHLYDIVDREDLDKALAEGYVRAQVHPTHPLTILNYSDKCVYDRVWNETTLACRGLIYNQNTLEVVARGFPKFFNYGEPNAPVIELDDPVFAHDKIDGSLAILYQFEDKWAVATRGSFASEQAIEATSILNEKFLDYLQGLRQEFLNDFTILTEVIYPANRIVLNYGDMRDLVLLGAVHKEKGYVVSPGWALGEWPGKVTPSFDVKTFADALSLPPRDNAERIVVRSLKTGELLKIKQADYVALHRIVTGLNARTVWDHIRQGKALQELIEPLPDEFHEWVRQVANNLWNQVNTETLRLIYDFGMLRSQLPENCSRKDFAMAAKSHPDSWAMFALLDDRDISAKVWERLKPGPDLTPGRTFSEDNA